jgi:ABC-type antimicrobial peptide transport system permease subunit
MTGILGLMSHLVAGRTKEIGIRMALGADPQRMMRSIIGQTLRTILPGLLVGLLAALACGRLVTTLLYDVAPHDPIAITAAIAAMIGIAAIAGYVPARRACRVEPVVALREE